MNYRGECPRNASCMSPETYEALRRERELRLAPMPGAQPVAGSGAAGMGSDTPAWLLPLAFLAGGFLITFALTRKG